MNGTYWDLFDSLHKDLSVYFFNWYFDRPMVISKERDMELHRVQQLLAKCLHFYADHYEEYLDLIPYDEKILHILDMVKDKKYVLGTFRPVKEDNILDHHMYTEWYRISKETADRINSVKKNKSGRVICVGTTSCRTLEAASDDEGMVSAGSAETDIFIYPGYQFKTVDALITNFHLPESTLIMLVSALGGYENVMNAYREAVKERYRFFSFGDAMFLS